MTIIFIFLVMNISTFITQHDIYNCKINNGVVGEDGGLNVFMRIDRIG